MFIQQAFSEQLLHPRPWLKSWLTQAPTHEALTVLNGNIKIQIQCKVGVKPWNPRPLLNVAGLDVGKGAVLSFRNSQVTAGRTVGFEMSREPSLSWFLGWDGGVSICILKSARSSHLSNMAHIDQPSNQQKAQLILYYSSSKSWLVTALHSDEQLDGVTSPGSRTRWIVAPHLRQCGLSACFHVLRRVAQFERSSSGNSWKGTRVQARLHWGRWCSCEPARVLVCRCRSALEQFTQSSTVTRKAKACRARRKREGAVHLVILEQLLGPAFSVLLGENNSIKGTRDSIITEWGDSRQLPAWLWKPFQILQESPHITCCSCWDHLGEMQNLAPTHPSRR